jgi:hypothetical protein
LFDVNWGTDSSVRHAISYLKSRLRMRMLVEGNAAACEHLNIAVERARLNLWLTILSATRRFNLPLSETINIMRIDPAVNALPTYRTAEVFQEKSGEVTLSVRAGKHRTADKLCTTVC